ncbi:hypothetical protein MKX03_013669 [Papaver bracteatum]|nr:hypothetical protein MKX03_013669 [Papaver bracteatum]
MASIKALFSAPFLHFIHKDLHQVVATMTLVDRLLFLIMHFIDKRHLHNQYNILNVGPTPQPHGLIILTRNPWLKLLKPDPMVVAIKLLRRKSYKDTGKQFNMIAASWIQFMIHDWIDHLEETNQIELTAPEEVASQCPLKSFKFYKTKEVPTGFYDIKQGSLNTRTPWWDGSAIYGSNSKWLSKVRTYKDGKLKISEDGLLMHDKDGVAISGDVRNSWAGVSVLQALFIKEHNAVSDALKICREYHELDDEDLYRHARLVTSAVIAKVHTIDWTVRIAGKEIQKDTFGHVGGAALGGLEFVSVYRMHPLLPEHLVLKDLSAAPGPNKSLPSTAEIPMSDLTGLKGEKALSKIGFKNQMVSMGHQACGSLELWNYPTWMWDLITQDENGLERPDHVDLPALEVYRDRERSVARYNEFRRGMLMTPISKWEDLTDDKEAIEVLNEVYGDDVEELDILVGLLAEKKIKGFSISETAFFIFTIMATRRLEEDRFFTSYFNEETYTEKGFNWVNTTESLKDVMDRHYPEMTKKWMNSASVFSVWDSSLPSHNPIPLYLRIPK